MEEWRDIPGYEGQYQVSSYGRARSLDRTITYSDGRVGNFKGRIFSDARGANGYRMIYLGKYKKRILLHQAIAAAFLPSKPEGAECINHKDGDKYNNRPENLEWATYAENNDHARRTGLQIQHGENCNLTRYSNQLVAAMRRVHAKYGPTNREMADLFDVSEMMASQVVRGETRRRA